MIYRYPKIPLTMIQTISSGGIVSNINRASQKFDLNTTIAPRMVTIANIKSSAYSNIKS